VEPEAMPKEVAYNKKKKQTNALSSLWQLRALISLLKSKQAAWNQNCWEVFKSHPGWLLSRPQGPFGSSFPEHISGQRPAAGHQDPHSTQHTAQTFSVCRSCLALACVRLTDARLAPGREIFTFWSLLKTFFL